MVAEIQQGSWDANGSPVEDDTPQAEPEPTPAQLIAQLTASCNAMEAKLQEYDMNVDISRVNIADLRVVAIASAALRLLQAKGLATAEDVELSVLSVLQEFLGGLLIQMEAKHDSKPPAPAPKLYVPKGARLRSVRKD